MEESKENEIVTNPNLFLNAFAENWLKPHNGEYPKTNNAIVANGNCFFHALGIATKEIVILRKDKQNSNMNNVNNNVLEAQIYQLRDTIARKELELKKNYSEKTDIEYDSLSDDNSNKIGYFNQFMTITKFMKPTNKKDNSYLYAHDDIIFTSVQMNPLKIFLNIKIKSYQTPILKNLDVITNYELMMNKETFLNPNIDIKDLDIIILLHKNIIHYETFYFEKDPSLKVTPNKEFVKIIHSLISKQKTKPQTSFTQSFSIDTFINYVQNITIPNNTFDFVLKQKYTDIIQSEFNHHNFNFYDPDKNSNEKSFNKTYKKVGELKRHFIKSPNGIMFKADPIGKLNPNTQILLGKNALNNARLADANLEKLLASSLSVFGQPPVIQPVNNNAPTPRASHVSRIKMLSSSVPINPSTLFPITTGPPPRKPGMFSTFSRLFTNVTKNKNRPPSRTPGKIPSGIARSNKNGSNKKPRPPPRTPGTKKNIPGTKI
jgi:hypothetical protein